MDKIWIPKSPQNRIKNVIDFGIDFYTILAPKISSKMHPKGRNKKWRSLSFRPPRGFENKASFFGRFPMPLEAFWPPPGRLFRGFWTPLGIPVAQPATILAASGSPFHAKGTPIPTETKKPKRRSKLANLPRTAENPPRFCREPAEDPPYEHHTEIFHSRQQPGRNFILQQTINEKAENRKWGGGAPPLGGLQLNNPKMTLK